MPQPDYYPVSVGKRKPRGVIESIVGRNLDAVMKYKPELSSNGVVARKIGGGFPARTVGRIRNAEVSCSLDTLAKLSKACGVEPWHLLIDGYDPANPPVRTITKGERDMYARIKADLNELKVTENHK